LEPLSPAEISFVLQEILKPAIYLNHGEPAVDLFPHPPCQMDDRETFASLPVAQDIVSCTISVGNHLHSLTLQHVPRGQFLLQLSMQAFCFFRSGRKPSFRQSAQVTLHSASNK